MHLKSEILRLWEHYTPLSKEEQEKRIDEVVYIIKKEDQIIGVSTAHLQYVPHYNNTYYFFRTFIHPDFRGIVGTGFPDIVRATNQRMQEVNKKEYLAAGMVSVTENPKLKRPGFRKLFKDGGWVYKGQTKDQQDIWFYPYTH